LAAKKKYILNLGQNLKVVSSKAQPGLMDAGKIPVDNFIPTGFPAELWFDFWP
jgi:hypothetical protein